MARILESTHEPLTRFTIGQWVLLGGVATLVLPLSFAFLEQFSFSEFARVLHDVRFQLVFVRTLRQAALSTIGCMLLGLPGAWFWARYRKHSITRFVLHVFSVIPFSVPPIIFIFCIILVFGNNGLINRYLPGKPFPFLYHGWAIIGAHILYNMGIFIRFVGQALRRSVADYTLVAQSMGASPYRRFRTVLLPLLLPAVVHALGIAFLFCFTSFAVVIVLGGGPRDASLEVMIFEILREGMHIQRASSIAGVQALIGIGIIAVYTLVLRRQHQEPLYQSISAEGQRRTRGIVHRSYSICLMVLLLLPVLAIVARFLERRSILFTEGLIDVVSLLLSFGKSLGIGLATAGVCVVIVVLLCSLGIRMGFFQRMLINGLSSIPLCLSPLILVLSLLILVKRSSNATILLVFVHSALSLPFVVPMCMRYLQRFPTTLVYASRSLGAGWIREFRRIHVPLSRAVLRSSASIALLISLGEFNAGVYLGAQDRIPVLSVYLFRSISRYRFEEGMIASMLLLVFVVMLTTGIEHDHHAEDSLYTIS